MRKRRKPKMPDQDPNYCEDCKHRSEGSDAASDDCGIAGDVNGPHVTRGPLMYVRREPRISGVRCRFARAFHACIDNVIDPVHVCPKWEGKC